MTTNRSDTPHIPKKSYPALSPLALQSYFKDVPPEVRSGLVTGLNKILNQQAVDERLNYDVIEKNLGGGVGQRGATIVIAASNSSAAGRASADFICDGTNDEVEIQAAVEILRAGNRGGKILFLEGLFNIASGQVIDTDGMGQGLTFEGQGTESTYIQSEGGANAVVFSLGIFSGITICNMTLDGSITTANGGIAWFHHLYCYGYLTNTVSHLNMVFIHDSFFEGSSPTGGHSIDIEFGALFLFIHDNFAQSGIRVKADTGELTQFINIHDNQCEGPLNLENARFLSCHDNSFSGIFLFECGWSADYVGMVANNINNGLFYVTNCLWLNVNGNSIMEGTTSLFVLNGTSDCTIANTFVQYGSSGTDIGPLIKLTGASHRNHVYGNTGRAVSTPADYFIQIEAGCNDNKVWGNDGFGVWDTAAVDDNGTGTDLTAANR